MSSFVSRWRRARSMTPGQILGKVVMKGQNALSPRRVLRRVAFALDRISISKFADEYREREEGGPVNIAVKLERAAAGGRFEPPDVELINIAAETLVENERRILEVGAGTGMFASRAARDPRRTIFASEMDRATVEWATANRPFANVTYGSRLLADVATDEFDLAVSLEVIEHISDFAGFLDEIAYVAPRAILSTPNKNRSAFESIANTPEFGEHVREWTAGEFYWVLRVFYDDVRLYTIDHFNRGVTMLAAGQNPDITLRPCGLLSRELPLLADCRRPRRRQSRRVS
jgi:2-polyprenyl-3-methyl-5-hydroxy-6-metoxy-1,4-benzoquinol methylase